MTILKSNEKILKILCYIASFFLSRKNEKASLSFTVALGGIKMNMGTFCFFQHVLSRGSEQ